MKKQLYSLCMLMMVAAASFAVTPPKDGTRNVAGTYGVYNTASPVIQLQLNDDGTFHLLDRTNPNKPVDTRGTWVMKNNTIRLSGYSSAFPINDRWRNSGTECLVSRRGLEWTRLCRH